MLTTIYCAMGPYLMVVHHTVFLAVFGGLRRSVKTWLYAFTRSSIVIDGHFYENHIGWYCMDFMLNSWSFYLLVLGLSDAAIDVPIHAPGGPPLAVRLADVGVRQAGRVVLLFRQFRGRKCRCDFALP